MFKNIVSNFFIKNIISILGLAYILISYYTSKITFSDKLNIDSLCKENENFIYAFWHDQLLMCPFTWKNKFDIQANTAPDSCCKTRNSKGCGTEAIGTTN